MSGPGSSSLPPRIASGPEPVTRIDRPQSSSDQQPSEQTPRQAGTPVTPAAPATVAESPHHDPAVSLAASFARLDRGALLAGLISGLSPEGDPVLQSPSGSYVIETTGQTSKALLTALNTAETATFEIIATERVIEARVITLNGKPPQGLGPDLTPALVKLILIKAPENTATGPLPARPEAPTPTYRPPVSTPAAPGQTSASGDSNADEPLPMLTRMPAQASLAQGQAVQGPSPQALSPPEPGRTVTAPVQTPQPQTASQTVLMPSAPALPPPAPGSVPLPNPALPMEPGPTQEPAIGRPLPALLESLPAPERPQVKGSAQPAAPLAAPPRPAVVVLDRILPLPAASPARTPPSTPLPQQSIPGEILAPQSNIPQPTRIMTAAGIVTLAEPLPLPPGTRVMLSLTVVEHRTPLAGLDPLAKLDQAFAPTAQPLMRSLPLEETAQILTQSQAQPPIKDWPNLELALAMLNPALTERILDKLPTPERLMTPVTLLFLSALGLRSPARLIFGREGLARLEAQGRGDLARLIDDEISKPLLSAQDRSSADWRSMLLPLRTPDGLQAIPLVVRQLGGNADPDDKDGKAKDKDRPEERGTRFLLDLRLGATGKLQFDGMIRERTFNLILRSEKDFPSSAASHIRSLFRSALEESRFTGDILLRTEPPVAVQTTAPQGPAHSFKA
ncbi:hypothetical protein [Govanella unica]|uniref:Flagellar hook-length control protein FliK n=1 Tax=Govanella unica TaxID=2975056 RepID=A0A9X3Z6F0_9PROT|nr:hypothetical protein [Govania unica]MDA5193007.1 hypothetical protein [Govania unica]